jgi:AcrR family transcriptional regulator
VPGSPDRSAQPPIWARPEPAARLPRFSRERIAQAALAIADAEGFAAVTMRRVAAELGSGTMSLYRYIATKADLAALLDDALMGEAIIADGELPGDWRAALAMIAHRTRDVYLRHPWAIAALHGEAGGGRSTPMGPNALGHFEQSLAALDGAPFDLRGKLDLLTIVDDYVMGHVLRIAGMHPSARSGTGPGEAAQAMKFVQSQLESGRFPQLQAMAADPAGSAVIDASRLEQRFELGLNALIDGAFRAWAYPATRLG